MARGTQQKITIKNTKLGQYGWIIWAEEKINLQDEKDWCLFPSKDCEQPAGFDWANVQPGDTVLLVWNRYDKTGQTRYYINGVIQHNSRGGAATATTDSTPSTASSTPTAGTYEDREAKKNRQIFVQGIAQAILANPNAGITIDDLHTGHALRDLLQRIDTEYNQFTNHWENAASQNGDMPDDEIPFQ